jgi:hypothetical protein
VVIIFANIRTGQTKQAPVECQSAAGVCCSSKPFRILQPRSRLTFSRLFGTHDSHDYSQNSDHIISCDTNYTTSILNWGVDQPAMGASIDAAVDFPWKIINKVK